MSIAQPSGILRSNRGTGMATPPSHSNARFTQITLIVEEIDDLLDTATANLDPLIIETKRGIALLQERRTALI